MGWFSQFFDTAPEWVRRARKLDDESGTSYLAPSVVQDEIWSMSQDQIVAKFGQPNARYRLPLRVKGGTFDGFLCEYWLELSPDVRQLVRIHYIVMDGKLRVGTVRRTDVAG